MDWLSREQEQRVGAAESGTQRRNICLGLHPQLFIDVKIFRVSLGQLEQECKEDV